MKRLLAIFLLSASLPLAAQTTVISGRYSNYSTEMDLGLLTVDTGRGSSIGFLANYRNGPFSLNGQIDHDFDNGVNVIEFVPGDFGDYSRDRGELTVGYGVIPFLDIEAGVRLDKMEIDAPLFDDDFFDAQDFDHQAMVGGIRAHSATIRPFGWYGSLHGYLGSAELNFEGASINTDTTGFKFETGFPIPVGVSGWEVTPGFEWERLTTASSGFDVSGLEFETNRLFINVGYALGR